MKAAKWNSFALALVAVAITGTSTAKAYNTSGFWPSESYPTRDKSYDSYIEAPALDNQTVSRLFHHVAFPQSRGALTGLLGWPVSYSGSYDYYQIEGSTSEIAIYYENDTALFFTVRQ